MAFQSLCMKSAQHLTMYILGWISAEHFSGRQGTHARSDAHLQQPQGNARTRRGLSPAWQARDSFGVGACQAFARLQGRSLIFVFWGCFLHPFLPPHRPSESEHKRTHAVAPWPAHAREVRSTDARNHWRCEFNGHDGTPPTGGVHSSVVQSGPSSHCTAFSGLSHAHALHFVEHRKRLQNKALCLCRLHTGRS